jgi:protocatechuate 3,4-dioxygenase beta subunit
MGGTVRDPEGAPIEGVRVEVKQPSLALGTPIVRTTDAQGRYRFEALSVGKVEFRFELGGSDVVSPVEGTGATAIKEGEELVRDVQFPRPNRSIEGVVLDAEGKPVAGGKVVCLFRPTFQERYVFRGGETKTDAAGNFRMENLVPGEYRVFFSGPAGEGGSTGRFFGDRAGVQPGGDPIEFRAPSPLPALISGKILNLDTGQGLAGSKVRLEVAGEILASDVSDVGGKFAFGARLSTTAPNILRVEHRNRGTEERWLVASEVRPDGSYPEVVFTVTRQRPESEPR